MSADKDACPTSFPQDVASCHAMLEGVFQSLAEKNQRIGQLEDIVDTFPLTVFFAVSTRSYLRLDLMHGVVHESARAS